MDSFMTMGTKTRHNNIITHLIGRLFHLIDQGKIHVLHEECDLVYWGEKKEVHSTSLVDIEKLEDINLFRSDTINELEHVQPDFMLFDKNKYIENEQETKTAGCPDLIVEIWSKKNTLADRAFKKHLYSTYSKTEHWYIKQDSNKVECYLGDKELPSQFLKDMLKTQSGMEIDLRRFSI